MQNSFFDRGLNHNKNEMRHLTSTLIYIFFVDIKFNNTLQGGKIVLDLFFINEKFKLVINKR